MFSTRIWFTEKISKEIIIIMLQERFQSTGHAIFQDGATLQLIAEAIQPNDQVSYKRIINHVQWIPPDRLPFVFHTASKEFEQIDPAFCQSFDYTLFGQVIPVTYVFPWPHVNRVKGHSEIWEPNKKEGFERSGLPYTYLKIANKGKDYGRIRMGSSMLDQYILAAKNNGLVFAVYLTELNQSGLRSKMKEYISLANLPVIDGHQFREPSPIGLGGGGLEIHLPQDIYRPEFTGFQPLSTYLEGLQNPIQRAQLIDIANTLISVKPDQVVHNVFGQLVDQNRRAFMSAATNQKRIFLTLK